MAFLELKGIQKSFGGLKALSGLNVQVNEGEIIGLIGPNGSGKTTSFNIITGFIKPDSGRTLFQGVDITNWSPHLIAKKGIVRTFQLTSLFLELSVLENVVTALNQLWQVNFDRQQLIELGRQLGADVPVFIHGENTLAEGVGDLFQPLEAPVRSYCVLVPKCHVSTAEIF